MPVSIAELCALRRCTSWRASGPVIQRLSPEARAVRPSRLIAILPQTKGRPCRMRVTKPRLRFPASSSRTPVRVSIPAARKAAIPRPATSGWGSIIAATTRETPASIRASVQGPVRPVWRQGSRVT